MTGRNTKAPPLTELHQAILDRLSSGGPATAEQIREALLPSFKLKDSSVRTLLRRLESRLSGFSPEERARVDEVTRLIVEKLLLEPTEQLKALPDVETQTAYTEAMSRIFRLGDERQSASHDSASVSLDDIADDDH